ncbi:NUDIX hydrolase [Halorussus halobius]|uniref:NUDIX hydrolase n=1 Tax=Halorussus halobius TaxID=1710537 RepID=UPI001091E13F|nr:NUDIX hydrolase [Halorussus halobius]
MSPDVAPDAPREPQTLRLPASKLDSFRAWATRGTALAAAARVRDSEGRIALVRNRWSDGWTLPGGAVESGESPAEAARREVREETGLDATVGEPLVVLDQSYVAEGDVNDGDAAADVQFTAEYVVYSAFAEGAIPGASELGVDADEIAAARWFASPPADLHDGDLLRPYL